MNRNKLLRYIPVVLTLAIWTTHQSMRTNNILIGAFGTYMFFMGWPFAKFQFRRDFMLLLLPALFIVFMIGVFFGEDQREGWHQMEKRIGYIAFPLIFYLGRNVITREDITRMLYAFLVACLALSLICYGNAVINIVENHSFIAIGKNERPYYYLAYMMLTEPVKLDPVYLSIYINFCILIVLFRPTGRSWINVILIGYLCVFNLSLASKAGILINAMVFLLFTYSLMRRKIVALGVCILLIAVFATAIFKSDFLRERFIVSTQFEYDRPWAGDWNSTSQRIAIWACSLETIGNNFPFGYGTGNGELELYKTYHKKNYIRGYEDGYNSHNEFLFTWLDLGIFGAIVLVAVMLIPLYFTVKINEPLYTYAILCFLLYFCVEVVLTRRAGINFLSFIYGLMAVEYFICTSKAQRLNA
ncbi:MAG: O-antigen ligase family protein [Chryseolinea sp.]